MMPGARGVAVVEVLGGERAELEERGAGIAEAVDAVARQQLAARGVALARALATAERGTGQPLVQLGDERAGARPRWPRTRACRVGVACQQRAHSTTSMTWPRVTVSRRAATLRSATVTQTSATTPSRGLWIELHLHRLEDDEHVALGDRRAGSARTSITTPGIGASSEPGPRRWRRGDRRRAPTGRARRRRRSQTASPSATTSHRARRPPLVALDADVVPRPRDPRSARPAPAPPRPSPAGARRARVALARARRRGASRRGRPRGRRSAAGRAARTSATAGQVGGRRRRRDLVAEALDQAGVELARAHLGPRAAAPAGRRRSSSGRRTTQLAPAPGPAAPAPRPGPARGR